MLMVSLLNVYSSPGVTGWSVCVGGNWWMAGWLALRERGRRVYYTFSFCAFFCGGVVIVLDYDMHGCGGSVTVDAGVEEGCGMRFI